MAIVGALGCLLMLAAIGAAMDRPVSINRPTHVNGNNWMHISTDYVRCYCNLPACVSTGYMCKSSFGGCFSDLVEHSSVPSRPTVYKGRHGCLELLSDTEERTRCQDQDGAASTHKRKHPKSLLVCCKSDLCNHVENPQTRSILNGSIFGQILDDGDRRPVSRQEAPLYSNSEVWFRAATIAVPICGAVILFVLIALAVKILKSENEDSHKLGQAYFVHPSKISCEKIPDHFDYARPAVHHQNLLFVHQNEHVQRQIKAPLLVQNDDNKNETNARLNRMQSEDVCEYLEKNTDYFPEVNMAHKVNKFGRI